MKLYAPKYYKEFKCIADKCRHSCCVGWEISIDEKTRELYGELPEDEMEEILSHVEDGLIRLGEGGKCPFLDESGLCRIISKCGEKYTSVICREHPRFYNFYSDRAEVGIGASCEEAARIILESGDYDELVLVGETDGQEEHGFDATEERDYIFSVMKKKGVTHTEKLDMIMKRYYLDRSLFCESSIKEKLSSMEYLREEDEKLFSGIHITSNEKFGDYSERFFAYLLYRHLGGASSFDNMRARLCLCILLVGLFEALLTNKIDKIESARLISEEIEYSEDNIDSLIFDFECDL